MLPPEIEGSLRQAGLIGTSTPQVTPLSGGVSCDIWRVEDGGQVFAVKRALPKLRVQADWFADVARNRHEQAYLRHVGRIAPDAVPRVLFADDEACFFAMEYLGGRFTDWKRMLLAGHADPLVATQAGTTLGLIHRATWKDPEAARLFATDTHFHDLRVAPYLLATAERHPRLRDLLHAEAARLSRTRLALVHGDYSPKNLMVAPERLVVLDCEVAWFGDPAFDLCFLINHLLLKSLHLRDRAAELLQLVEAVLAAYRATVGGEVFSTVSAPAPALLLGLMLARIDGKSPVEYLDDPAKRDAVRGFVASHLPRPPEGWPGILRAWRRQLSP